MKKLLLGAILSAVASPARRGWLVVTFLVTAPGAEAVLDQLCTYFNNAQHSQVVGQRGIDCCGNPVNWGSTSIYYQCYKEVCVWCPPPES